jgi:hypothetical protein
LAPVLNIRIATIGLMATQAVMVCPMLVAVVVDPPPTDATGGHPTPNHPP